MNDQRYNATKQEQTSCSTEEFPWELLPRLQSTFIPPDFTASVARLLERLVEVQSVGWQDRLLVLPALEARRDVCRKAAADGSGLVEVVKFSCC